MLCLNLFSFCNRELFNRIAAEDMEFSQDQDSDFEIPDFGDSTSNYSEVNENSNYFFIVN